VAGVDAAVVAVVSGADELDDLLRAEGATA
jgi:hypothetical protein